MQTCGAENAVAALALATVSRSADAYAAFAPGLQAGLSLARLLPAWRNGLFFAIAFDHCTDLVEPEKESSLFALVFLV